MHSVQSNTATALNTSIALQNAAASAPAMKPVASASPMAPVAPLAPTPGVIAVPVTPAGAVLSPPSASHTSQVPPAAPARAPQVGFAAWLGAKLGLITLVTPRCYNNRWALITGASSGIGACFAEELARRGANVMLAARSEDKLRALATHLTEAYGARAEVLVTDLATADAVPNLLQQILDRGLRVDVLVNNAGLGSYGRSETTDPARQRAMLQVNMGATTELAQACLPAMRAAGEGTIFNLASIAAFVPMPYMASYAATKAYVLSFSEALWAENRHTNVRVLAVCPGPTATAFFEGASFDHPEAALGKLATSQSVVDASLHAADQDRPYIISNTADYFKIQASRWAPRATVVTFLEQVMRPVKKPNNQITSDSSLTIAKSR